MIQPFLLLVNNLYFIYNVTLLNSQQTESTKYNISDRIVSDIQCRAEGETFYVRYNTVPMYCAYEIKSTLSFALRREFARDEMIGEC